MNNACELQKIKLWQCW